MKKLQYLTEQLQELEERRQLALHENAAYWRGLLAHREKCRTNRKKFTEFRKIP